MPKGLTVLADGDIVVYRCAFAAEHTEYMLVDKESGQTIGVFPKAAEYKEFCRDNELDMGDIDIEKEKVVEPLSHALANVKSVMARIEEEGDKVIVCLSKGNCYRYDLATMKEYKGNRKDMDKPVYYKEVRDYLCKNWDTRIFSELEADDAVALMQADDTVIASIDKDLLQVPGRHYDWVQQERWLVAEDVGQRKKYIQVLTGDSTDNIPGIRGIGPVKARTLLRDCKTENDFWKVCVAEWEKFLQSDAEKPLQDLEWNEEDDTYSYTHWNGERITGAEAGDIVTEVLELITVGGYSAEKIAESSGEALLLTRETPGT
jgi:hypothetical protein